MTGMLLVIPAKLAVGGLRRLFGDEAGSETSKRICEGDSRLEDTKTQISGAHHSLPVPLDHPVVVALSLGEQPITPDERRHGVTVLGALRGVNPKMGSLGHTDILAWLYPKAHSPIKHRTARARARGVQVRSVTE